MSKKSFKAKIIIPAVIVLVVLVVVLNVFLSMRFMAISNSLITEKLTADINSFKFFLEDNMANSRVAAISMSRNLEAINAIQERDTVEILRIFASAQDLYRVNFFTVCDAQGVVLGRSHEPDNYGDSVLNQQNVIDALEGRVSTYFEAGTAVRVSVRSGSPVYDNDGVLIGAISGGVRFDSDSQVEELKKLFHTEVTLFSGNTRIATTITQNGQSIVGTTLDPRIEEIVIRQKREYIGDVTIQGNNYTAFYMPLLNAKGEAFATFFLGIPEANIISASRKAIRDGIILGLCGLAVSIVFLLFVMSSISRPISELAGDMDRIASGDLSINVKVKSDDELGLFARSLQKVADILDKLLKDINIMITEQKKGNIDYHLDATQFLGDYRILADSVLELSSFGMNDKLTGIPNRRSFDNRMDWEWNRAIRDKTPISMLLLDVDKFKNYNDSFGHQQGDVALQTIAKTIKQTVKRSTDFSARWGGEEFAVLLPATDSTGAVYVAEKIREAIENAVVPSHDQRGAKVTISIGVSTLVPSPENDMNAFVTVADNALYKAKEAGRNRVAFG